MVNSGSKRRTIVIAAVLVAIAALLGGWRQIMLQRDPPVRQIYLTLNTSEPIEGPQFWIRVTEQPDKKGPTFVGGANYTFDSGLSENGPWERIMIVRLDDPDPIPTRNVAFVSGRQAYVFLYDRLAVTEDAGRSWSVLDLGRVNSDWGARRAMIKDVVLSKDGTGTMHLRLFAAQKEATLNTRDFGKSWTPE